MFSKSKDILAAKRRKLANCQGAFDAAVIAINQMIASLNLINDEITDNVSEIESYQRDLDVTKADLNDAKKRNEQVIRNFQALLNVE